MGPALVPSVSAHKTLIRFVSITDLPLLLIQFKDIHAKNCTNLISLCRSVTERRNPREFFETAGQEFPDIKPHRVSNKPRLSVSESFAEETECGNLVKQAKCEKPRRSRARSWGGLYDNYYETRTAATCCGSGFDPPSGCEKPPDADPASRAANTSQRSFAEGLAIVGFLP